MALNFKLILTDPEIYDRSLKQMSERHYWLHASHHNVRLHQNFFLPGTFKKKNPELLFKFPILISVFSFIFANAIQY